ncbi:MAG TPA: hypothetical protein VM243_17000 [Phycisphaerae bacterium]|nr:hypothetical protein [Phycisphaerae bacterium]
MTEKEKPTGLERVAAPFHDSIQRYTALVREIAGARAQALTLFGAIAAPGSEGFDPKRHTVRSVLVLDAADLAILRRLAEYGARLGKDRISAPLIMTPEYIRASLDTFPLELLEIHQQHLTIFGDDFFTHLVFDAGHMRLQCERELKVILIGMRQGLLAAVGREKAISAVEADVTAALVRTLRGFLWLKGVKEARPGAEVVAEVERLVERKLRGVQAALDTGAPHGWPEFEGLYRDVEAVGEIVNAL